MLIFSKSDCSAKTKDNFQKKKKPKKIEEKQKAEKKRGELRKRKTEKEKIGGENTTETQEREESSGIKWN